MPSRPIGGAAAVDGGGAARPLFYRTALEASAAAQANDGHNVVTLDAIPDGLVPGYHMVNVSGTSRSRGRNEAAIVDSIDAGARTITLRENLGSSILQNTTLYFPAIGGWDQKVFLPSPPGWMSLRGFTYELSVGSRGLQARSGFSTGEYAGGELAHSFVWQLSEGAWNTFSDQAPDNDQFAVLACAHLSTRDAPKIYYDATDRSLSFVAQADETYRQDQYLPTIWDLVISGG